MENNVKKATRIRDKVLDNITDRRGWRQEWEEFDVDVQQEIESTLYRIILEVLESE
jgi:hypothetical protein